MSEGCNPSSGKGVWGATKKCPYVCPRMSRDSRRLAVTRRGSARSISPKQLRQRHVGGRTCLSEGPGKDYVRIVVVGRLVPSKGLLLVRRALDESIESAVPYVELSAVPHVELQFVRSTGTLLSASDAPRAAPWYIPIPADAEGLHGARYRV
jgi:hypothetical protein